MDEQTIIDYVMHSPANTNRAVLKSMLDSLIGGDDDIIYYDGGGVEGYNPE